jgi:hypothetical protein
MSSSAANVSEAVKQAQKTIAKRQQKLLSNQQKFASLKMEKIPVPKTEVKQYLDFGSELLTCHKGFFSWPIKKTYVEHEDCTFKLNIGDPAQIKKLYATINQRQLDGWQVDKVEVHKQNIISQNQINNEERYRFVRLKTN